MIVYIDSNSSDNSLELSRTLATETIQLDLSTPFSAARARNVGFKRLIEICPELRFAFFIDGDCKMAPDWPGHACDLLRSHEEVAIVTGRLKERNANASLYNRLCQLEWDGPSGELTECGGIFFARASDFLALNGFNESLIAGEEPELCLRLRRMGKKIVRIPGEMAEHDAAMSTFGQWWKRSIRSGYAYANGMYLHGRSIEKFRVRNMISIWLWGGILPLTILAGSLVGIAEIKYLLLLYPLIIAKIAWSKWLQTKQAGLSLLYGAMLMLAKFAEFWGQCKFWTDRMLGLPAKIIEYKPVPPSHG